MDLCRNIEESESMPRENTQVKENKRLIGKEIPQKKLGGANRENRDNEEETNSNEKGEEAVAGNSAQMCQGSIWDDQLNLGNKSKQRSVFHSRFADLKKKLKVPLELRKTQIDSLLKKCKSKFFKSVHAALKACLIFKLERLPQNFITNIKIEFNKNYMTKTVLQIYMENQMFSSEQISEDKFIRKGKKELLHEFLSLTLRQTYELYLTSNQYLRDYSYIQEAEGEDFAILFNYVSRIFVQYYTLSKGNKQSKKRKIDETD